MCKKKKKDAPVINEPAQEFTLDNFELQKPEPAFDENGNRDYFIEYYNAYKNDYIDQYLAAYRRFKEDGTMPPFSPYQPDEVVEQAATNRDGQDEIDTSIEDDDQE